jgi:hypothetical protein
VSRALRGSKRDALRVAAELVVAPSSAAAARTTVGQLLELWREHSLASWAPSTASTQESRLCRIRTDSIAGVMVSRLRASDVGQWHVRLARLGVGESSIRNQHQALRAALGLAVRWGWVPSNVAAAARLRRRPLVPRSALTADEVRRVLTSVAELVVSGKVEPHAALALRLAAITGARRSELAEVGSWFTGKNVLPERTWETRSEVVAASQGREFAFIVNGSWTRWGYALRAVDGGTELTESWEFLPGGEAMFQERFGADAEAQIANRLEQARTGIPATLAAIKRDAEGP